MLKYYNINKENWNCSHFWTMQNPQIWNYLHLKTIAFLIWYSWHVYFTRPFCKIHAIHTNGYNTDNRVAFCTWPISKIFVRTSSDLFQDLFLVTGVVHPFFSNFLSFFFLKQGHVNSRLLRKLYATLRNKSILYNLWYFLKIKMFYFF